MKNKKKSIFIYGAVIVVCILILFMIGDDEAETNADEVQIPKNYEEFSKSNYQDVVKSFEEAGFTNIETEPIGDLVTGLINKEGSVDSVSVGDDTEFDTDWVKPDIKVIIRYHSFPEDSEEVDTSEKTKSAEDNSKNKDEDTKDDVVEEDEDTKDDVAEEDENNYVESDSVREFKDNFPAHDAWAIVKYYCDANCPYGYKLQSAFTRHSEVVEDPEGNWWFLTCDITVMNQYGAETKTNLEAKIRGTSDNPDVIDIHIF